MSIGLAYVGKIISMDAILNADRIVCATVVCGQGGKWKGIVRKQDFGVGERCIVFLPDAIIPEREDMKFMKDSNWRVKMRRFRGAPSEVVIMPINKEKYDFMSVGDDLTGLEGVTKYCKPVPANLAGTSIGYFPNFIPKTDEPNYQRCEDILLTLHGFPYYITQKCDGSSTTAYKHDGKFGVCSRNLELKRCENNGYWKVAIEHNLESNLPDGYALQWETCGPGIQSNRMGLDKICGFAFSGYNIKEHKYLEYVELMDLCDELKFPMVKVLRNGASFDAYNVAHLGEGIYDNGNQQEGVVIRSQENLHGSPISFKVINLNYDN